MVVVEGVIVVIVGHVGGLADPLRQDLVVACSLALIDSFDLRLVPLFDLVINWNDLQDCLFFSVLLLLFIFNVLHILEDALRALLVGVRLLLWYQVGLALLLRLRVDPLRVEVCSTQP